MGGGVLTQQLAFLAERGDLPAHFGQFGTRLHALCRGLDERAVSNARERKSVSVEETYTPDVPDLVQFSRLLETGFMRRNKPVRLLGLGVRLGEEASREQLSLFNESSSIIGANLPADSV